MIMRLAALALVGLMLAGCAATKGITSVAGGEAKVFEAPPYAVRGVTQYDQNWIDDTVEGGVAAFGWRRPAERPPELDRRPAARPAPALPVVKRPGVFKRLKARVSRSPPAHAADKWPPGPVAPVIVPPAEPRPAAPTSTPPKQRDDVDELLDPSEPLPAVRRVR